MVWAKFVEIYEKKNAISNLCQIDRSFEGKEENKIQRKLEKRFRKSIENKWTRLICSLNGLG